MEGGAGPGAGRIPASNLLQDGAALDLYVYKSEAESFSEFNDPSALVWMKEDLVYGDWTGGPNADGTFFHSMTFPASEVRRKRDGMSREGIQWVRQGREWKGWRDRTES